MAANPKNPSTLIFWNDLENDERLKTCSLAAKGLWTVHMLAIAARSSEPGKVIIGDHPCRMDDDLPKLLARVAGESPADIAELLAELVASGTASVDDKGRICNRRMVREDEIRQARSRAGKGGAAVTNAKRQKSGKQVDKDDGKDHGKAVGKNEVSETAVSGGDERDNADKSTTDARQNPVTDSGDPDGKTTPSSSFMLQTSGDVTTTESPLAAASLMAAPEAAAAEDDLAVPSFLRRENRDAHDAAMAAWNEGADRHGWKRIDYLTSSRRFGLDRIFALCGGVEGWKAALEHAPGQAFLRTPTGEWQGWFTFDWMLNEDRFTRLMEGLYAERHRTDKPDERSTANALAGLREELAR